MEPVLWSTFLAELSLVAGVTKAAIIAHNIADKDHRMLATFGEMTKESIPYYENCYYKFDEWTLRSSNIGKTENIVRGEEIWPETSLLKSTFYHEFLRKFDTCQMACLASIRADSKFEVLSVYRGPSEAEFGESQLGTLQVLASHLQTAFYTRRKLLELESRVGDLESALDQMSTALALIDDTGRVVFANEYARQILSHRDGLFLHKRRLAAQNITENTRLREIVTKAILACQGKSITSPGAMLITRHTGRSLHLIASPLRSVTHPIPVNAIAALFITDPDRKPSSPVEVLRILFGLTPAEGRLTMSLLDGFSLSEAADLTKVGKETVRSQIKSIFQKTATRRQGELIRLLAGISAPYSPHATYAIEPLPSGDAGG
jgi:DNA-binding CsgD family transcriptional regulator/PAS domain-containing protein